MQFERVSVTVKGDQSEEGLADSVGGTQLLQAGHESSFDLGEAQAQLFSSLRDKGEHPLALAAGTNTEATQ